MALDAVTLQNIYQSIRRVMSLHHWVSMFGQFQHQYHHCKICIWKLSKHVWTVPSPISSPPNTFEHVFENLVGILGQFQCQYDHHHNYLTGNHHQAYYHTITQHQTRKHQHQTHLVFYCIATFNWWNSWGLSKKILFPSYSETEMEATCLYKRRSDSQSIKML